MATETVTIVEAIRDWLRLVGEEYGIYEAHHIARPDDGLKVPMDYFTFSFTDSRQINTQPADNSAAPGSGNDVAIDLYMPFDRTLRIECYSEHGMEVLEAVLISAWHPAIKDILGTARLAIISMPEGVANETTRDETQTDHLYTATFGLRKHTHFTVTRTNHIWDHYSVSGTLTLLDDVSTVSVTATDT